MRNIRGNRSGNRSGVLRGRRPLAAVGATLLGAALALTAPGVAGAETESTPELNGAWAPLDRCPVDDPAMLAADGAEAAALCLTSASSSGTMTIGDTTVKVTGTDLQSGIVRSGPDYHLISPEHGAIVAEPVRVPGGLLGIMCPSDIPVVSDICQAVERSEPNTVMATVKPAGDPDDFTLAAGVGVGEPILTLPVKIHLENPFLGPNCYIGSDSDPIVLQPANQEQPTAEMVRFDQDGSLDPDGEMGYIEVTGTAQIDDSFTVPKANGCGFLGMLNPAVNLKMGLPSPSGANSLVLDSATTQLGGHFTPLDFAPDQGQKLSEHWHAAIVD